MYTETNISSLGRTIDRSKSKNGFNDHLQKEGPLKYEWITSGNYSRCMHENEMRTFVFTLSCDVEITIWKDNVIVHREMIHTPWNEKQVAFYV